MPEVINHKLLCRTNLNYFGSEELVGRKTIIDKYDALENFIKRFIDPQYRDFISYPVVEKDDTIEFYGANWVEDSPQLFNELSDDERSKYQLIKEQTVNHYCNRIEELKNNGNEEVADFLRKAIAFVDDEFLFCYDNKVVMGVWGMKKLQNLPPQTEIMTIGYTRYLTVRFKSDETCSLSNTTPLKIKSGDTFTMNNFPSILPKEGYENPHWTPDTCPPSLKKDLTYTATCNKKKVDISFVADTSCYIIEGEPLHLTKEWGDSLSLSEFPKVIPNNGFCNPVWNPKLPETVTENLQFTASCSFAKEPTVEEPTPPVPPKFYTISFYSDNYGTLNGSNSIQCEEGTMLNVNSFPSVIPNKGYSFKGWDAPNEFVVNSDRSIHAIYEADKLPWWKRLWIWLCGLFAGKGCLKWLLRFLFLLLLLLLLIFALRNCTGCSDESGCTRERSSYPEGGDALGSNDSSWLRQDPNVGRGGIYNPSDPYRPLPGDSTSVSDGVLPSNPGLLPPIDDTLSIEPADPRVGSPRIITNRLNILMENEDKSIVDLAKVFVEKYPQCKVIYYDDVVKRMQINCSKEQRQNLKQEIPAAFAPDYDLFVFDEALFESQDIPNDPGFNDHAKTWYLEKIGAYGAWDITKGKKEIVVAIIDNGFNLAHPEFKDKVIVPYNVWTHNQEIFPQRVDHGTHVAGTAIALADNGKGLCGIAPNCKFMPVQVADKKGIMTTTSVLDGILFALYQGADVINVSLGGSFDGLSAFPESQQKELIDNHFKEEERLWNEISRIAASHKSTIVVAAGNDNVLAGIEALQRPDNFIVVSAVDKNNSSLNKANFSNYGKYSTISAPGVSIYSSYGNGFNSLDGTSMAAPIITGTVALMKSLNDSLTTKEIKCILKNTALPVNGKVGGMVQIDKALSKVRSGEKVDCRPIPSTGDVQILLSWNDYNDIDLSCSDPNGDIIWYRNKMVRSGGQLEIDMNVEYPDSQTPIENIYWPTGAAPDGTYNVYVKFYRRHVNNGSVPYKVKVKHGDQVDDYSGTLDNVKDVIKICSFTMGSTANEDTDRSNNSETSPLDDLQQEKSRLEHELERVNREIDKIRNRN